MQIASMHFKERAHANMANAELQRNLQKIKGKFVAKRRESLTELDDFEATREEGRAIRQRALDDLDVWLEIFERNATARGATVLWAETPAEINAHVLDIARRHGARKIIKSKSMVSEESELDRAIEAAGLTVVETDLGEYILQINDYEPPSHIIGPALHKSKEEVADLFAKAHATPRKTEISELCFEARGVLRQHYLTADMGISGGNFFVAETGSVVLVTNEGNATLTTTLPRVHVAISGIEKIVPTLEDIATLMRLLPRSATGQSISNYVDILTGVKGPGEFHGAEHMYFIVVDAGRSTVLGSELKEALRCIRCGACMNHCPVYQSIGGHSYGWVYPGPIGSILTPSYIGIENALDLPQASTLCNQCGVVCPVKIPLPDLLRKLREQQFEHGLRPWTERLGLRAWSWLAARPGLYALAMRIGARMLSWMGGNERLLHKLLLAGGWTEGRDMPAPEGHTFRDLYAGKARK
ncbi:MAG TPA: LutB/LldF family L-lactate oxidation iron-sulfur protein [Casimicrobiaceae bacterium]|jgi:L-lactate dehydrogenase complex protein LldF|nr:LutB/LldF family L-lactate oxidation iron-sulfur protein [Casimicrobiaceae bacterium]